MKIMRLAVGVIYGVLLVTAGCAEELVISPGEIGLEVRTENPNSAIKFHLTKDREGVYEVQMTVANGVKDASIWKAMAIVRDFLIKNDTSWRYINFYCSMRDVHLPWVPVVKAVVAENEEIAASVELLRDAGLEKETLANLRQLNGAGDFFSTNGPMFKEFQLGLSFGELKVFGKHQDFGSQTPPIRLFVKRGKE